MLRHTDEQYPAYELDFSGTLYMLRSLKQIALFNGGCFGEESDELTNLFCQLETMDFMRALHEISLFFVQSGDDGSVSLPTDSELGKHLKAMQDPADQAYIAISCKDETNPEFVSALLEEAAKFFRPAVPGLIGSDSDMTIKANLVGLQLPDLGDETLVFSRKKEAEKFKDSTSFPTKLVRLERTGWEEYQ